MKVYSTIDFGNDHEAEKKFILRNSARFASYMPLQHFKDEVLATIKIYEEEFNVGDKLPTITLPDQNGHPFSTASLNNQYYLIDFWSTLCQQCMIFKTKELEIANMIPANQLEIVSVAIDDQTDEWKKNIILNGFKWPQLIDVKMWEGPAVRTLLFDSIPSNFLVAPGGKVIAKAIKPDSLVKTIAQLKLNK
jgi:thiol-disulfide isomerase/thioredoxin